MTLWVITASLAVLTQRCSHRHLESESWEGSHSLCCSVSLSNAKKLDTIIKLNTQLLIHTKGYLFFFSMLLPYFLGNRVRKLSSSWSKSTLGLADKWAQATSFKTQVVLRKSKKSSYDFTSNCLGLHRQFSKSWMLELLKKYPGVTWLSLMKEINITYLLTN